MKTARTSTKACTVMGQRKMGNRNITVHDIFHNLSFVLNILLFMFYNSYSIIYVYLNLYLIIYSVQFISNI